MQLTTTGSPSPMISLPSASHSHDPTHPRRSLTQSRLYTRHPRMECLSLIHKYMTETRPAGLARFGFSTIFHLSLLPVPPINHAHSTSGRAQTSRYYPGWDH